jgi:hypothetical protein
LENEVELKNFKGTETFLRFLCKVFKSSYPMECLSQDDLSSFDKCFIVQAIQGVYLKCMTQYFHLKFANVSSFAKLTARALKLASVMLEHFREIPQSIKAPLLQPMPRYDSFLELNLLVLNHFQIEQIAIHALKLSQPRDRAMFSQQMNHSSIFMNKWLIEAQK